MAQRQWRSDDTSTWTDAFGTGSDGAYAPSTGTDAPIDSACTGTSGTTSLSATNASFAAGQFILIHQTQKATGAGVWELNKIDSYVAGTITTSYALTNTYATGAQVLVMKQYSSALIDTGVTLTGKAWNGTVGGIMGWFCKGTTTITGTLTSGTGFVGGNGNNNQGMFGDTGEGNVGASVANSSSANGNGGGGGRKAGTAAGGGGNGTAGGGTSGTAGNAGLTVMVFGGGGGGTGMDSPSNNNGTAGSGMIILITKSITITGDIICNGTNAQSNAAAGAGGSVLLKFETGTLGTTRITATGGTGGENAGGVGRIHADYSISISGTTNPTIDTTLDATIIESSSGGNFFAFM